MKNGLRFENRKSTFANSLLLPWCLLLRNGRLARAFAGAGVGGRTLAADRQAAAVAQAAVAADVHQTLDVHLNAFAQVAFDVALCVQDGANLVQLFLAKIPDLSVDADIRL